MAMILENLVLVMPNGLLNNKKPLVAVFMVTYNHASFIARSIESVLSQNTTFDFQLFIGEDGSSDGTGKLCQQYADLHPERVKLFCREKNIGVFENANLLFEACLSSGAKYIAMLEGDDCWISNDKLQQQITYLEQHDDCAGSYHNTDFLYANGDRKAMFKKLPDRLFLDDVIERYSPFHTTSFVFRSKHFCRPTWFKEIHSVDLAMYMWHAQFGYFKGFSETWSLYRIHDSGMTAGKDHNEYFHQKRLMLYQMMNGKIVQPFNDKLNDLIQYHLSQMGSLKAKEMKKILFFDTKENFESQILKMNIEAAILPFKLTNGRCNGFFSSFKLTSIKWFNAIQLRWQYRKHWPQIKAVVFLSRQDADEFNLIFPLLKLPYLIVDEMDTAVHSTNNINTELLNL
jgi:glycosyltransferase involved in cell wall biosynthesis